MNPIIRFFAYLAMGVANLGIGVKITYWTYMDWLPSFDYFDGVSLILISVVLFYHAVRRPTV